MILLQHCNSLIDRTSCFFWNSFSHWSLLLISKRALCSAAYLPVPPGTVSHSPCPWLDNKKLNKRTNTLYNLIDSISLDLHNVLNRFFNDSFRGLSNYTNIVIPYMVIMTYLSSSDIVQCNEPEWAYFWSLIWPIGSYLITCNEIIHHNRLILRLL